MFNIVKRGIHGEFFTFYLSSMHRGAPSVALVFYSLEDAQAFLTQAKAQPYGVDSRGEFNLFIMKDSQIVY